MTRLLNVLIVEHHHKQILFLKLMGILCLLGIILALAMSSYWNLLTTQQLMDYPGLRTMVMIQMVQSPSRTKPLQLRTREGITTLCVGGLELIFLVAMDSLYQWIWTHQQCKERYAWFTIVLLPIAHRFGRRTKLLPLQTTFLLIQKNPT